MFHKTGHPHTPCTRNRCLSIEARTTTQILHGYDMMNIKNCIEFKRTIENCLVLLPFSLLWSQSVYDTDLHLCPSRRWKAIPLLLVLCSQMCWIDRREIKLLFFWSTSFCVSTTMYSSLHPKQIYELNVYRFENCFRCFFFVVQAHSVIFVVRIACRMNIVQVQSTFWWISLAK